jgi:hypothetical protein
VCASVATPCIGGEARARAVASADPGRAAAARVQQLECVSMDASAVMPIAPGSLSVALVLLLRIVAMVSAVPAPAADVPRMTPCNDSRQSSLGLAVLSRPSPALHTGVSWLLCLLSKALVRWSRYDRRRVC